MINKNTKKQFIITTLLSALIFTAVIIIYTLGILKNFDNSLQDAFYQSPGIVTPDIYVIGIDEETLSDRTVTINEDGTTNYGDGGLGPFQTWTRADLGALINKLNEDPDNKPAVIGVDILFSGTTTDVADAILTNAAKQGGNVVVGAQATFGTALSEDGNNLVSAIKTYEEPFASLRAVTDIGHINTYPDGDGVIRHGIYKLNVNGDEIPSFSQAILNKYNEYWEDDTPITAPPLNTNNQFYITYTGMPGDYFGSSADGTSVIRVLRGDIDPAMFAGSIVLVGPYSFGMLDSYYTPISTNVQMHGVEIHANIIQALMEENYKKAVATPLQALVLLVLGLLCILLSKIPDMRISGPMALVILATYIFIAKSLFDKGYILSLIYPILLLILMYVTDVVVKYIIERREKQKIKGIFKKYVDPKLVDKLIVSGEADSNEVGKKKDIAVLFVDVRGFTPMSERLKDEPETVVKILNEYLELTSQSIFDNGGSVDKFIGDATMALFNGFVPLDDYEYKAVCAAWDIVKGSKELNESILEKYGVNVGFGVGVNCGDAVVGNLGPSFRKDFTAIGDTVNTSARLEANAKAGTVLLGPEVYERLKDRITAESMGEIPLKGKSIGLMVYELKSITK